MRCAVEVTFYIEAPDEDGAYQRIDRMLRHLEAQGWSPSYEMFEGAARELEE